MTRKKNFENILKKRLEENKLLEESGVVPEQLKGFVGVIGWHFLVMGLVVSFMVSVGVLLFWLPQVLRVARRLMFI